MARAFFLYSLFLVYTQYNHMSIKSNTQWNTTSSPAIWINTAYSGAINPREYCNKERSRSRSCDNIFIYWFYMRKYEIQRKLSVIFDVTYNFIIIYFL